MSTAASTLISNTLQNVTNIKIAELEKRRNTFRTAKHALLGSADSCSDLRQRLAILVKGLRELPDAVEFDAQKQLRLYDRWIEQAKYDTSLSENKLVDLEQQLRNILVKREHKLELANLYSNLFIDWIKHASEPGTEIGFDDTLSEKSFDMVENSQSSSLAELKERFAKVALEPKETDEAAIHKYLLELFGGREKKNSPLGIMRQRVRDFCDAFSENTDTLGPESLKSTCKALLKVDLLSADKKASLKDFLKDEAVLQEISDVLNMRLRNLDSWEWDAPQGIPIVPRQHVSGKWRVMMDEDVLQALLTHWIGARFSKLLDVTLRGSRKAKSVFKRKSGYPKGAQSRRQYFLDSDGSDTDGVTSLRDTQYEENFFLSPFTHLQDYDAEDSKTEQQAGKHVKQILLRTVATEVVLQRELYGEVAVVASDFTWFGPSLPHSTVFAAMRFIGFTEKWTTFFKKFLEPPLDLGDGRPVRTRKRGLPMAQSIEPLLGELVLYFLDVAVAQNDGSILYRFHDDLYLVGKPERCAASWKTMQQFSEIMGMEYNKDKTGSAYIVKEGRKRNEAVSRALPEGQVLIHFLALDPVTGEWMINQNLVQDHIEHFKKQLNDSKTVLDWIRIWNHCTGRFFSYTLGEPAHCFGVKHLEAILATHQRMQEYLFDDRTTGQSVTERVRHLILKRFPDAGQISDPFILMPEQLGGLAVYNPFVSLLLLKGNLEPTADGEPSTPAEHVTQYLEQERNEYEAHKETFEELSVQDRRKRYKTAFGQNANDTTMKTYLDWKDADTFMTFEEFTRYREYTSPMLTRVYETLLSQPEARIRDVRDRIQLDSTVGSSALTETLKSGDSIFRTVKLYEKELYEKYGGLEVVDKTLLPLGVLQALKKEKVRWLSGVGP